MKKHYKGKKFWKKELLKEIIKGTPGGRDRGLISAATKFIFNK